MPLFSLFKPQSHCLLSHVLYLAAETRSRCPQLSATGYAAAAELWPEVFAGVGGERQAELMAGMRVGRARLVSGFESMVMVRGPWRFIHMRCYGIGLFAQYCRKQHGTPKNNRPSLGCRLHVGLAAVDAIP